MRVKSNSEPVCVTSVISASAKRFVDAELVSKVFWALAKVSYRPTDSALVGLGKMAKGKAKELEDENVLLVMHAMGRLAMESGQRRGRGVRVAIHRR